MTSNRSPRPAARRAGSPSRLRPLSAALLILLGLPAVQAATILVDSDADGSVVGRCTLRDAVAAANADAAVAGCAAGSGADTIQFAPDVASITLAAASGGSLLVTNELVLDGRDRLVTVRRELDDETFRIIESQATAPLVLRWMKLTGGRLGLMDLGRGGAGVLAGADLRLEHSEVSSNVTDQLQYGHGGGVSAEAGLDLVDSVVSGNATIGPTAPGGGIYADYVPGRPVTLTRSIVAGNATLGDGSPGGGIAVRSTVDIVATDSTIADNWTTSAGGFGGGFYAPLATVTLIGSQVSGNVAEGDYAWGGGGYAYGLRIGGSTLSGNSTLGKLSYGGGFFAATADVSNSTVSGNATRGDGSCGGGLAVNEDTSIRNSTVFGNEAELGTGGGVCVWLNPVAAVRLDSTLVSGNGAAVDADLGLLDPSSSGTLVLAGSRNLFGAESGSVAFPADTLRCDPQLLPLAANGGATLTHRLGDGSCAIDAGANPDGLSTDQRGAGHVRTFGAATDIGATERQPADQETIFGDGFDPG